MILGCVVLTLNNLWLKSPFSASSVGCFPFFKMMEKLKEHSSAFVPMFWTTYRLMGIRLYFLRGNVIAKKIFSLETISPFQLLRGLMINAMVLFLLIILFLFSHYSRNFSCQDYFGCSESDSNVSISKYLFKARAAVFAG